MQSLRSVPTRWEHVFVLLGPNQKGALAEIAIAREAARLGLGVWWPLVEHSRCDLIVEIGSRLLRTQCKWGRLTEDVITVSLESSRHTAVKGYVRTKYSAGEVDAVAVYCAALDRVFLLPIELVAERNAITLRLHPARNNQRAAVNFAADYEFAGAVAQLEEHLHGMQGVVGSSPISSIRAGTVGAEEFGAHAPRYIQRAKAGEHFLITRRGRPMAALVPPDRLNAIEPADGDLAQPSLLEEPPGAEAA